MNGGRLWLQAALLGLCFAAAVQVAQAQRATLGPAGANAGRASSIRVRTAPVRVRGGALSRAIRSASPVPTYSPVSPQGFLGGTGAFGLLTPGFGFSNFGSQDLWIKAAIDPATQWRLFESQRFGGNYVGVPGFYLWGGGTYYEPPTAPPEAEQPPAEEGGGPAESEAAETAPPEQQPASGSSVPVEDVGQFVLVLRNGTQLQTVAFTRADDRIVYVTSDGLRRTIALADLDAAATIRINEERGTPLQIPLAKS
jgi:hypothetical protein